MDSRLQFNGLLSYFGYTLKSYETKHCSEPTLNIESSTAYRRYRIGAFDGAVADWGGGPGVSKD